MRRIEDEATRMGGLVEDLLLLARLDEQRPGRAEPVDLAVLAGDAVHDAARPRPGRAGPAGRVWTARRRPGPATVIGDEDRLRQVVANLVGQRRPAHPGRHPDRGRGRRGRRRAHAGAVLEVRDHGPGLPAEHAERVFERFYRVDASRQRGAGGGSGLGLSIVSAVAAAHGGTASVRETDGRRRDVRAPAARSCGRQPAAGTARSTVTAPGRSSRRVPSKTSDDHLQITLKITWRLPGEFRTEIHAA